MAQTALQILMLGDVVGKSGLRAAALLVPKLKMKYRADLVVMNGENADEGFGLSPDNAQALFSAGVDVITTGNHVWQHKQIRELLDNEDTIIRPANYPGAAPGRGYTIRTVRGSRVAVMQLQGRIRLSNIDCPFRKAKELIRNLKAESDVILLDFHAEASDEKEALGLYLDGSIAALVGTHTHVQTADARVLPNGTAYITDLGMTGPGGSVIGFTPDISIRRSLTQLPLKNEVHDAPGAVHGVLVSIEPETGLAKAIETIQEASAI